MRRLFPVYNHRIARWGLGKLFPYLPIEQLTHLRAKSEWELCSKRWDTKNIDDIEFVLQGLANELKRRGVTQ